MIHALNWLFLNAFILLEKRIELKNECIKNELKILNAFMELKKMNWIKKWMHEKWIKQSELSIHFFNSFWDCYFFYKKTLASQKFFK